MATKEVRYDIYCKHCEFYGNAEHDDPCWDCLENGWNENSHRPIFFKGDPKRWNAQIEKECQEAEMK